MKLLKVIVVVFMFVCSTQLCFGQIVYSGGRLGVNVEAESPNIYSLNIKKWTGMLWSSKDSSRYLQLDVSPLNPRIAGGGELVSFYNTVKRKFNSIHVNNVYCASLPSSDNLMEGAPGLESVLNVKSYRTKEDGGISDLKKNSGFTPIDSLFQYVTGDDKAGYYFDPVQLKSVLPGAVRRDADGEHLINYGAMIPVLVQSIQELHSMVESQAQIIAELQIAKNANVDDGNNRILSCSPNPVDDVTVVELQIEDVNSDACLVIADVYGNVERRIQVGPFDTQTVDMGNCHAGVHVVSLYVNGSVRDAVRVVKR